MSFWGSYFSFLLSTVTIVIAILVVFLGIVSIATKNKLKNKGRLKLKSLNDEIVKTKIACLESLGDKKALKVFKKSQKKDAKNKAQKKRLFVVRFVGDMMCSDVSALTEEVNAVVSIANPQHDEVLVSVESGGGVVHGYGLAASQLARLKEKQIPLTVAVDKVAASGGYMMASVADKIIAAPFAILGSIGVLAQLPNFNRLLDKHGIDFEQQTAGKYKRTVTMFGKNTDEDRAKFKEELEDVHGLFKSFVSTNRPQVDIEKIATGEHWYGERALEHNLCDVIKTFDDYLFEQFHQGKALYEVAYKEKKSLAKRFKSACMHVLG